jgi:transcription initiation factor TFIIB
MRTQHDRARIASKTDRNQVYGFTEIRRLVGQLDLPTHVRERACTLFRSAQDANLLQGRTLEGFAAAAVYATCRADEIARSVSEVVAAAKADEAELRAAYDALNRELGLPTGPVNPREYIPRYASRLDCSRDVERRATDLAVDLHESGTTVGRNPCGVAAACLYAAAEREDESLTQREVADVAGVTPVTLRVTYTDLTEE